MQPSKFSYYVRRLRSLRPSEPYWRLRSSVRHWWQKRAYRRDPKAFSPKLLYERQTTWLKGDAGPSLSLLVRHSIEKRLPPRWWQDPGFWKAFEDRYPVQAEQVVQRALSAAEGRFTLFQWKEVNVGDPPRWSSTLDETRLGDEWPADFYADIQFYHDPDAPERDVKWCWEVNRFQQLLHLGAAWKLTRDEHFARAARGLLESWIRTVRYPTGVQWSSNLEVALRALSWARCHILCMDADAWDEEFIKEFLPYLYLHANHLEQELSVHHALSNHLLGEAAALMHLGILYEPFKDAERWLRRGGRILERVVPRLILPDGVYAEQTTGYFRFVSEFLLPLLHLAAANGIKASEIVHDRVAAGLTFVKVLAPDPRNVPMIGDADSGTAIGWQLSDYWDFSWLLAAGSVLLADDALRDALDDCPAEAFLLLGPDGLDAIAGRSHPLGHAQPPVARDFFFFPQGGYQVSRDRQFHVVFDSGPLGMYPGFGHGHADGLSFVLSYNGMPVVVDPGTFLYNGHPSWREYFRSTNAHNTVSVDGRSQSTPAGTFAWSRPIRVRQSTPWEREGVRAMAGVIRWPNITHERMILHVLDQGIVIVDFLSGTGHHRLEWTMHWSPLWEITRNEGATGTLGVFHQWFDPDAVGPQVAAKNFTASAAVGDLDVTLLGPEGTETSILRGSVNPPGGWYSRSYGLKEPVSTLRATVQTLMPAKFVTLVKPRGTDLCQCTFRRVTWPTGGLGVS